MTAWFRIEVRLPLDSVSLNSLLRHRPHECDQFHVQCVADSFLWNVLPPFWCRNEPCVAHRPYLWSPWLLSKRSRLLLLHLMAVRDSQPLWPVNNVGLLEINLSQWLLLLQLLMLLLFISKIFLQRCLQIINTLNEHTEYLHKGAMHCNELGFLTLNWA